MAFFSLQRSDSSVCIRDDKWWSSAYLKTYRSKLVRLPTNVFGHCHHLVNDGLDLLLKIKKSYSPLLLWLRCRKVAKNIVRRRFLTSLSKKPLPSVSYNRNITEKTRKIQNYFIVFKLPKMSHFYWESRENDFAEIVNFSNTELSIFWGKNRQNDFLPFSHDFLVNSKYSITRENRQNEKSYVLYSLNVNKVSRSFKRFLRKNV